MSERKPFRPEPRARTGPAAATPRPPAASDEEPHAFDATLWPGWAVGELVPPPLPSELDDPALARAQERFWDHVLREARARETPAEQQRAAHHGVAFAARLLDQLAGPRLAVQRVACRPPERAPALRGRVAEVLQAAAMLGAAPRLDLAVAAGAGRELWDEACDSWVELPDGIPAGRYLALSVTGDSMLPLLHPEDIVLVRLASAVARDTVVVARHPENGYVVKQVGAVTDGQLELLSLNPAFPPITIPRDDQLVLGTVVLRWCAHGA
jgi:hypothetical protein